MRKTERERTEPAFMAAVLEEAEDCVLSMMSPEGPYAVPVNYVHLDDKLYIHCAPEGRKLDLIRADARVAFTTYVGVRILRKQSSTAYRSVCGTGLAVIVEDREEKRTALDAIGRRYKAGCPVPTPDSSVDRTCVIRVDIRTLSGKCAHEDRTEDA